MAGYIDQRFQYSPGIPVDPTPQMTREEYEFERKVVGNQRTNRTLDVLQTLPPAPPGDYVDWNYLLLHPEGTWLENEPVYRRYWFNDYDPTLRFVGYDHFQALWGNQKGFLLALSGLFLYPCHVGYQYIARECPEEIDNLLEACILALGTYDRSYPTPEDIAKVKCRRFPNITFLSRALIFRHSLIPDQDEFIFRLNCSKKLVLADLVKCRAPGHIYPMSGGRIPRALYPDKFPMKIFAELGIEFILSFAHFNIHVRYPEAPWDLYSELELAARHRSSTSDIYNPDYSVYADLETTSDSHGLTDLE